MALILINFLYSIFTILYLSTLYILLIDIQDMDLFERLSFYRPKFECALLTSISIQVFVILICYKIYMENMGKIEK